MNLNLFKDKTGEVVPWQSPNPALYGWAAFTLIGRLTHRPLLDSLGTVCLLVWAILEIFLGVNYFRRALGLAFFLLATIPLIK